MSQKKNQHVFYWRGKGEVDFVILDKNTPLPYQVCWEGHKERHFEALEEFKTHFPNAQEPQIITRHTLKKLDHF